MDIAQIPPRGFQLYYLQDYSWSVVIDLQINHDMAYKIIKNNLHLHT